MDTLFTMTKVSHRMRVLANDLVDPVDRFEFNLTKAVKTDKERMTATRAKSEYLLTENDLAQLGYEEARNPHYRNAAPMRLYDVDDLVEATLEKYQVCFLARARSLRDPQKWPTLDTK